MGTSSPNAPNSKKKWRSTNNGGKLGYLRLWTRGSPGVVTNMSRPGDCMTIGIRDLGSVDGVDQSNPVNINQDCQSNIQSESPISARQSRWYETRHRNG
eukprot:11800719-Ditylum_brightwellii.AAC.3